MHDIPVARLLVERAIEGDVPTLKGGRAARSVTMNLAESPLGWLFARGHVSRRDGHQHSRRISRASSLSAAACARTW